MRREAQDTVDEKECLDKTESMKEISEKQIHLRYLKERTLIAK